RTIFIILDRSLPGHGLGFGRGLAVRHDFFDLPTAGPMDMYEVLWRVSHGDRTAMLAGDKLGSELQRRIKQASREAHHLHAFV
ncbi:DUF4130 domain-containing protein, partial [Klebsiella pneumoniae]|nr:DUF4130 domain-containing protein [Klebsiella pneumoniae]